MRGPQGDPGEAEATDGAAQEDKAFDERRVRNLLDDPDAKAADLLTAFRLTLVHPPLRDALLRHPRISEVDLRSELRAWPAAVRDRAMSATDQVPAIEWWARSADPFERAIAGMNPYCPRALAEVLADDPHPGVRANAACCPQLPAGMRARLAHRDPDDGVRDFAAWLIATDEGHELTSGNRYSLIGDGDIHRVVAYGMGREAKPPV